MTTTVTPQLAASLCPADTSEAELYECPVGSSFVGDLRILSIGGAEVAYSVATLMASGSAVNADWSVRNAVTRDDGIPGKIPVCLKAGQAINVVVGEANAVTFQLTGQVREVS